MKVSPARRAAFEILLRIENENAFSSVLLPHFEENLDLRDRALCHQITLGVLRTQLYLDKIIAEFSNGRKLDPAVRIALRIGLYQLLFLDRVPDYSVINESVNLVQLAKKTSAKGLVNALLRRCTREPIKLRFSDEIERISIENSHPRWLLEKWIKGFGFDEAQKIARANNEVPKIAFRATATSGEDRLFAATPSAFVHGCYIADSATTELIDQNANDEIYFQDEASQMAAASVLLENGQSFLDVCAAPGSKTTQVAKGALALGSKFLAAGDLYQHRVRFLDENCRKQGVDIVNVLQYDALDSLPFVGESFDRVLLDAPCSGTGTIRHNPEIRYSLRPEDVEALAGKQLALLKNASYVVKPRGRLIYSTCSLEKEENEDVCDQFLSADANFNRVKPNIPERFLTPEGYGRTFPHREGMDGFFIAAFEKDGNAEVG